MQRMHDEPNLAAIDLNLLVVLRALLSERHVTRAAAKIGLSQSATSHALGRLRTLYGDPLLVRSGSQLELTPRAVALLPALERALRELQATIAGPEPFDPKTARRVFSLGTSDYGQAVFCGPLLSRLAEQGPNIDLEISQAPNPLELLVSGALDMAMVVEDDLSGPFSAVTLLRDNFACMVRASHPTVRARLSLQRYLLLRHVVVAPYGSPGSIVDARLAKDGYVRRVAARIPNFLAAPLVVTRSDFINTGPAKLAHMMAQVHAIRVLAPPIDLPEFELRLVWHRRYDQEPGHRWLRQLIASVARAL